MREFLRTTGVPIYSPVDIAAQAATVGVRPEQGPTLREMIIVSDWEGQNPRLEAAALADFV